MIPSGFILPGNMERSGTMRKKCLITFLTAVLLLGGLAGKSVLAEKKTSADPEAEVQGFEEFSYDTDDKMFLVLLPVLGLLSPNRPLRYLYFDAVGRIF